MPSDTPARGESQGANKPWPYDWPQYLNGQSQPCDMLVGPCCCGAWHHEGEFAFTVSRLALASQPQGELPDRRTNWQIAEEWYDEASIVESVKHQCTGAFNERQRIPPDVTSEKFGKWLTHEYRLAMNKGLQLAGRLAPAPQPHGELPGELCGQCGNRYGNVYRVPDDLWAKITGRTDGGGLLCMACCEAAALPDVIYWEGSVGGWHKLQPADEMVKPNHAAALLEAKRATEASRVAELESLLPSTFYADRPLAERLRFLVDQWRKLVESMQVGGSVAVRVADLEREIERLTNLNNQRT